MNWCWHSVYSRITHQTGVSDHRGGDVGSFLHFSPSVFLCLWSETAACHKVFRLHTLNSLSSKTFGQKLCCVVRPVRWLKQPLWTPVFTPPLSPVFKNLCKHWHCFLHPLQLRIVGFNTHIYLSMPWRPPPCWDQCEISWHTITLPNLLVELLYFKKRNQRGHHLEWDLVIYLVSQAWKKVLF